MQTEMKKRRYFRKRRHRTEDREVNPRTYILPSLFTTGNLFCGFFGMVKAIGGDFQSAAVAIIVSWIFDILDGKVARLTRSTSRFGVEYDSLTDLVAFGVGPGLLMFLWALRPYGRLGWLGAFVFVACGALRLARFNVQAETGGTKKFFVGLPIPGAAAMVATTVLFMSQWDPALVGVTGLPSVLAPHLLHIWPECPWPEYVSGLPFLVVTYLLGFLMVSNIPYNSYKEPEVVKEHPVRVISIIVLLLAVIAVRPQIMLFTLVLSYVVSGPVSSLIRLFGKKDRRGERPQEKPGEGPSLKEDRGSL
jgi:CDP-diacylglycerol--serine O-phosphatidyltransferase